MNKYPHDWSETTLGDICDPKTGLQTGPFGSQLHASDYTENGIPVVMPRDIINSRVSTAEIARVPGEIAERLSRHRLLSGDIVFGRRGDIGRCALITGVEEGWLCGTGCLRTRVRQSDVLSEFLIFYLDLSSTKMWLETNAVGQTMLNLNTSILSELPIVIPPLPEQRKIAAILSTWDEAITLTSALIAALQRRKGALMQLLLTGQVRFPEFEGEWEDSRLGELFRERRESGFDDLPLVAITGKGIVFRDTLDRRDTSSEDKSNYLRIWPGDIGYNTMRMWQGVSGVSEIEGIVSPAYTICVPNDNIDVHFVGHLFKMRFMIHRFWRY